MKEMTKAPKKILCIDDDRETAKLMVEQLTDRGFEVFLAHEGHAGFVEILKGIPDLAICAIRLPDMSSFEMLERLNELSNRLDRVPFVVLTGSSERDDEIRVRQLGADDYVTKPIDFDILETIIDAQLAHGVARSQIWPTLVKLSDCEADVLTWAALDKTTAEIADVLSMPNRTIDYFLDNARVKLGASTRVEATVKAVLGGLIKPYGE